VIHKVNTFSASFACCSGVLEENVRNELNDREQYLLYASATGWREFADDLTGKAGMMLVYVTVTLAMSPNVNISRFDVQKM